MEGNEDPDDPLSLEDVDDPKPVVHLCTGICKDSDEEEEEDEEEERYEVVSVPDQEILCLAPDTAGLVALAQPSDWSYITIAKDEGVVNVEGSLELTPSTGEEVVETGSDSSDELTRVVMLEDGRLAYLQPKQVCEMVPLDEGCMTLMSVGGEGEEERERGAARKRPKSFLCMEPGCARAYTSLHHLKIHRRNHTGIRPYVCSVEGCRKAFATDYSRKAHLRTHTGEKPYACPNDSCDKSFKTSGDLQKHIRTHTGERPFVCPVEGCNRSFTTSNIRKVHIRTHTGERPYVCSHPGCDRSFASTTNYKNHMRIHSGEKPFICPVPTCQKRFTEYSSLYKHGSVHCQEKRHRCPYCSKTYRQNSALSTHKRTVHGLIYAEDGSQLPLEEMIGVATDGSRAFTNITTNLLRLKRDSTAYIFEETIELKLEESGCG